MIENILEFQQTVELAIQDNLKRILSHEKLGKTQDKTKDSGANVIETFKNTEIPGIEVRDVLKDKSIRKFLCPILQRFTGDVMELAKIITPSLATLYAAGLISIPWNPLIVAGVTIVIARIGVASFCTE